MSDSRTYNEDEVRTLALVPISTDGVSEGRISISNFTTTTSTPVLLASIPIAVNKSYQITTYMMAVKSDGSTRNVGTVSGVFSRVAGNLSQDGTLSNALTGVLSTTKITYVLNNTTHAVEVYANGLALTTINWNAYIEYNFNT